MTPATFVLGFIIVMSPTGEAVHTYNKQFKSMYHCQQELAQMKHHKFFETVLKPHWPEHQFAFGCSGSRT